MKLNNKGFTLVELLTTIVVLGIIMAIAVPNVMGILNKSRADAYVSDAKKFVSIAEYKIRGSRDIEKPAVNGQQIAFRLDYLDNSEFDNAPGGGAYDKNNSYVIVKNDDGHYSYKVVLIDEKNKGVFADEDDLFNKESSELVKADIDVQSTTTPLMLKIRINNVDQFISLIKMYKLEP